MSTMAPSLPSPKLAFIVPSSNTAVESLTIAILSCLPSHLTVLPIFTCIRVLTLGTDASSLSQFSSATFLNAASLLADAQPAAILWTGTSGMFTGGTLQTDRDLAASMIGSLKDKIPCSTTTPAFAVALKHLKISDVSIATPYIPSLTTAVASFFEKESYTVHAALSLPNTPSSNLEIAKSSSRAIKSLVRQSVVPGKTQAVLVTCTNWPAAPFAAELEKELDVYVLDSVTVTLWYGLRMMGMCEQMEACEELKQWGRLFSA